MIDRERLNKEIQELNKHPLWKDAVTHRATSLTRECNGCLVRTAMDKKLSLCETHIALHAYLIGRMKQKEIGK